MKKSIKAWTLITLAGLLPLSAEETTTTETQTSHNADGSVTRTETTTHTFNPEVQTKVVTYFDAYKAQPYGLPPGWVSKVQVKRVPPAWRSSRIAPGVVVAEKERTYLVAAPPELVQVLPAPTGDVRYYVAGSNVVAVDGHYKIIDSVQIPTIKYTETDDEVKIEKKEGDHKTKIEIDKDDGEVDVDEDH
ncbi:MAG: hypothetical protein ABIS50_07700 [Luteolibacter sp.]|uniref:hypothetical protein n=1 Tax=Luteolibacter sp. TaxID=1962973 RepID=UPI00326412E6